MNTFLWWILIIGPDLVVADEAHIIKDPKARISEVLKGIRTERRVALTGSPVQNNLMEYYFMVSWAKPLHLGRPKTFKEQFVMLVLPYFISFININMID